MCLTILPNWVNMLSNSQMMFSKLISRSKI